MKKLILIALLFLSATHAYAYVDVVSLSVANSAAATAAANAEEIAQAKRDNEDVQLGIALCNKQPAIEAQTSCLISLQNKIQQQRDENDADNKKVLFWFTVICIALVVATVFIARL